MAQDHAVSISDMTFQPGSVTVAAGDTVTWTNKDNMRHTVTADDGSFGTSQPLRQNQTFSHTFDAEGTFPYHCEIHPDMTGEVIVGQAEGERAG